MEIKNTMTKILNAVLLGQVGVVNSLLETGEDVNEPSEAGSYPIVAAASLNNTAMVKLLLEHNASPEVSDSAEHTAMYWAKKYKNTEMEEAIQAKIDYPSSIQIKY